MAMENENGFKKYTAKDANIQENISRRDSNDRSREQVRKENAEKALNGFRAKEIVNGIQISVAWEEAITEQRYTIVFPQTTLAWLGIGEDAETSKRVFEYAREIAASESDVNKVYQKVKALINNGLEV